MMVKCIINKDESWITAGKLYRPLEIYNGKDGIMYRLIGDDGETPAVYSAANFEVIDCNIPENWSISIIDGNITLANRAFQKKGFWEDLFNEDKSTIATFNRLTRQFSLIDLSQSFVRRCLDTSWANVKYLVDEKWMPCSLVGEFAVKKVSSNNFTADELYLSGLGKGDETEIYRLLNSFYKKDEVDLTVIANILIAWGYENNFLLDDPMQFVEEIYFKFNNPEKIKHFVRYLTREVMARDILRNWKMYLDSEVYTILIDPA